MKVTRQALTASLNDSVFRRVLHLRCAPCYTSLYSFTRRRRLLSPGSIRLSSVTFTIPDSSAPQSHTQRLARAMDLFPSAVPSSVPFYQSYTSTYHQLIMRRILVEQLSRLIALRPSVPRNKSEPQITHFEHDDKPRIPLFVSLHIRQIKRRIQWPPTLWRHK